MTDAQKILDINRGRLGLSNKNNVDDTAFSEATGATRHLCVYGRMRPGGPDHHVLSAYGGIWQACQVTGYMQRPGACVEDGECPGLAWTPAGDLHQASLLASAALRYAWSILDAHEGAAYARLLTTVQTPDGPAVANVYAAADASRTQILLLDGMNVHDDRD